jgi:hypothetical protein
MRHIFLMQYAGDYYAFEIEVPQLHMIALNEGNPFSSISAFMEFANRERITKWGYLSSRD